MADTASFSAALKTQFIGPIREVLHAGRVLLWGDPDANPEDFKGIRGTAEGIDLVGNEFRIPIKTRRNQAVGFRAENAALPAPGSSNYTYLSDPLRYDYASFSITGQLLKASASNEGAFAAAFKTEVEDTTLTAKIDMNRAAFGDSSGKLCAVVTAGASGDTQVAVDTTINFRGIGEIIDFVTPAGAVLSAAHTVTAVDRTLKKITVTPALGAAVATTAFPVRASISSTTAVPNNSQNSEINGLGNIVSDTGVLHGLNPATYNFWKSYVQNVGGSISDVVLRAAKDAIGFETGLDLDAGLDYAILTTRGIRTRYAQTLTSVKRFNDAQSVKLHGGFTAVMFDENPIFIDDQCPVGTVYGLALNKMFWSRASDWEWMEEDGKVMKWVPGFDRYQSVLFSYCNLGTTHRGAHFKLTGVTDDSR